MALMDKAAGALRWAKRMVTGSGEYNPEPVIGKRSSLPMRPRTPAEYVEYVNKRYDRWYQHRYPYEAGWYLDVAFYLGLQWHEWNEQARALREPRSPSWRVKYVVNEIMPTIETMVGKFTQGQPSLTCSPKQSPSDRAQMDAKMGEKLLKGLRQPLRMTDVNQEFLYWLLITGHAYQKTMWDPTKGRAIRIPGQPVMYEGDICNLPVGPYGVLTPPHLKDLCTEPFELIESRMFDIEHARMLYPEVAAKIQPRKDMDRASSFEQRLAALVSPLGYSGFGEKEAGSSTQCMVKEHWQDPQTMTEEEREEFPDGRTTIIVNDEFVDAINNPLGFNPFTVARAKIVPGRFIGASMVDQLIGIQRNKNRARSDVIESRMLCSRPMINVEAGHGITKPIAEPGKWMERRKGWAKPEFLDPPRMSDYHVKDMEENKEDFQAVSQIREVSRGQLPAANVTGVAINLLQQSDNTPLGPLANRLAEFFADVGMKVIKLAQKFYVEPRMINVTGEGHETEVLEFLGDRHPTELTVKCDVDSILPESRAAKQARAVEAVTAGVIDPIRHGNKLRKMLHFGDPNEIWEEQDGHEQKAHRENKKLMSGVFVPVDTFDDDIVHMASHDRVRVGTEYEQLNPQMRAIFDEHCNMHLAKQSMLAGLSQQMGQQPGQQPGAPPSAGPEQQDPAMMDQGGMM